MGVIVKPKNLNDRQMKRVDRIEESNPLRARTVASRISARRDARGAENPQIAKAIAERRYMAQPMKKGGKIIKKAQNGIVGKIKASWKKAGEDLKQADRDYKSSDSVRNLPIKSKSLKGKLDEMKGNRAKADSLYKVAKKREAGEMKKGGKMIKKAKNGTSFGMLSVKAGIDKNPKPTAADRIAGAKKKMKSGGTVSMQLGSYTRQIGKNYTGKATKAVGLTKAKYGTSIMKKGGKCKNGC